MLVGGCNLAQLTASAFTAMYSNCAPVQAVHNFFETRKLTP